MNKRDFLRLLPAIAAGSAAAQPPITNWAGNLTYSTGRVEEPESVEGVRQAVARGGKLKVQGTRHCFNDIADSDVRLLSLRKLREVSSVDAKTRTVTVDAGVTYGHLAPILDRQGYALHNLASLPHISVAGACATATHGSGEKNGNLATAVAAIEMITAAGDAVKLTSADGARFQAAVVGLGALGIVTRVTLRVEPTYAAHQYVYQDMPLAQALAHFDEVQAAGYSVSLFTDWQARSINEVWLKRRVKGEAPAEWLGAKLARKDLHPIAALSPDNCTVQRGIAGPWYERLPHFKMGFTPSAGKELQSEYFVARRHSGEALQAIQRLGERIGPHLLISEIRTVAADELWMSTAYGQASVAIHFTWKQDWPNVGRLLPVIERELGPYAPRPHWGKLFTVPASTLRTRYPRWDEFRKAAAEYDPGGRFRNAYLDRTIFGG